MRLPMAETTVPLTLRSDEAEIDREGPVGGCMAFWIDGLSFMPSAGGRLVTYAIVIGGMGGVYLVVLWNCMC